MKLMKLMTEQCLSLSVVGDGIFNETEVLETLISGPFRSKVSQLSHALSFHFTLIPISRIKTRHCKGVSFLKQN